jgi:hypothetical protein
MHFDFMTIIKISGMLFSNQLGQFPITSNRSNKYVVIFYIYNATFVKSVPIKSRSKEEILWAYRLIYAYLTARGCKPQLHKMDNKMSHDVKTFICKENMCLQYTPSNIHRTNQAEREIHMWKNHFLSGIAGLPKTFPFANWCRLTNQTDFILNMLWPCRQNPALSAFKVLKWSYSFNSTPMAPLGTKVLVHHKPNWHSSWDFLALNAWYISPFLQHYQCIKIIMRNTGGKRITDTFRYKHHAIPVPEVTATDRILKATHNLTAAIEGIQEVAPDELQAIKSLRPILLGKQIPQEPCPPPPTPLNDSYVDKAPIHMWDLVIHAQPIMPSNATQRASQTVFAIIDDGDAPPHLLPEVHTGSPAIIDNNDNAPPMIRRSWTWAQLHTQVESHLINMVIQDSLMPNFSFDI